MARMTASPISRMGTSVGDAGGSLAERHDAHQHRVARARHPARAAAAAQFAVCLRGRDLLDSGAVLLGDGIQAIRPVHRTDRIGPAIESAHARSRRPTRGGFSYRWCARRRWRGRRRCRRGIRDPYPRVRRRDPVAAQLVPPGRKLHDARRWRRRDRDRCARRRRVANGRAIARRWIVVGRRIVRRRRIVHGRRRVDDGRRDGSHSEREERPDKRANERA